jgi:enediyne biosynthesis protein E4
VGAQVRVTAGGRTQLRFVSGGNGFAAQGSSRIHVGLAAAARADKVEVRWPSGTHQIFTDVPANRIHVLKEGRPRLSTLGATTVVP